MAHDASIPAPGGTRAGTLSLLLAWLACTVAAAATGDPPGRVAQVNLVEGSGAMQADGATDWSGDLLNRPLADGDRIWIDPGSRAEIHVGSTALRLGSRTALQVLNVDDHNVHLALTEGSMVMHVRSMDSGEYYQVSTPAGGIAILQAGIYRIDVDGHEAHAYLAVRSGWAELSGPADTSSLHIDEAAEIAANDTPAIRSVSVRGTDSLDHWADERDQREEQSSAADYVPRDLVGYQELDGNGEWYTDPVYGPVWAPYVVVGWVPYRYGYWNWIYPWGWTWVAAEPWGFAPCHYGRWVQARHGWAWAPGPRNRSRPVFSPALVSWSHDHPAELYARGTSVPPTGLAPLHYNEIYTPLYPASQAYLRAANLSNTHLGHAEVDRYINERPYQPSPLPRPAPRPVPHPVQPTLTPVRPTVTPVPRPVMRQDTTPARVESTAADRPPQYLPRAIGSQAPPQQPARSAPTNAPVGAPGLVPGNAQPGVPAGGGVNPVAPHIMMRPDRQP